MFYILKVPDKCRTQDTSKYASIHLEVVHKLMIGQQVFADLLVNKL